LGAPSIFCKIQMMNIQDVSALHLFHMKF